ncbi:MAG: UDP-3-O-(3-hydroxymyristoyl)glucosamine N-acyltransferase [bacterium]|jgi:UDP-3-O-[3-hydroxymyristoyl] glucosamine N-acyltransferase
MEIPLKELAEIIGGDVAGDGSVMISGVGGIREARAGDVTFLADPRYEKFLKTTKASAVIAPRGTAHEGMPLILCENPYLCFIRAVKHFIPEENGRPAGVHPTAVIAEGARLGKGTAVGPHAVIEDGVAVGDGTAILAGVFVGRRSSIGAGCLIYPNVSIREDTTIGDRVIIHCGAVIGSDGFGYARDGEVHRKIPQIGNVVIEDDVEVGANSTIDRAATGSTTIGKGTKIDNLAMIAHNVTIGENCIVIAQVGISGSTDIGNNVNLAGQAGIAGHVKVGDGAVIAAQAGVTKSVKPGACVSGYPAREHSLARKIYASLQKLPELVKRVADLSERVKKLEEKSDA